MTKKELPGFGIRDFLARYRIWIIVLGIITILAYGNVQLNPSLFGDDWGVLEKSINSTLPCPDTVNPRLLGFCPYKLLLSTFGANIIAYKTFSIFWIFVTGLLLLFLLATLLPAHPEFNFVVVALFLVYPTVWIKSWLYGFFGIITCIILTGYLFIALFIKIGDWRLFWIGLIFLVGSFLIYEIAVGLTICLSLIAYFGTRTFPKKKRLALLIPAGAGILFSAWRLLAQIQIGSAFGHSTEEITLGPTQLLSRFIMGYRINLQWGWSVSLLRLFPWLNTGSMHQSALASLVFVSVMLLFAILITFILRLGQARSNPSAANQDDFFKPIREYSMLGVIGLLVLGAGYVPILMVERTGLAFSASRHNYLPSIGAAIILCSLMMILLSLLGNRGKKANLSLIILATPLIILGVIHQLVVQAETLQGWKEQKAIWQQMFNQAPDFAPGTAVVLLLPGYADVEGARPFESGTFGFSGALNLLYGHPLNGYFAYPDTPLRFTSEGISHPSATRPIHYENTVLFTYNRGTGELTLEKELPPELKQDSAPRVLCTDCILNKIAIQPNYRSLVK